MNLRFICFCALLQVLIIPSGLRIEAHQFWIQPGEFNASPGAGIAVRAWIGSPDSCDPIPRMSSHIAEFSLHTQSSTVPIPGLDGSHPAGVFPSPPGPALWIANYVSHPSIVFLTAQEFENHLHEENLTQASDLRRKLKIQSIPAREQVTRFAKSMGYSAFAGERVPDESAPLELGHLLEIIPAPRPSEMVANTDVAFIVRYRHDPSREMTLHAKHLGIPGLHLEKQVRDQSVIFEFPQPGPWMLSCVAIEYTPENPLAEWASSWASLTLLIHDPHKSRN